MQRIYYCEGYKYQLRETFEIYTGVFPEEDAVAPLVTLTILGRLRIEKYFAWDGCTKMLNDRTNARACLVHDALFYLMRMGVLPESYREACDFELSKIMIIDSEKHKKKGLFHSIFLWLRPKYYNLGVRLFAEGCAKPANARKILVAP